MRNKKESLISKLVKKFSKKKDVEKTESGVIEIDGQMLKVYQEYCDKKLMTETQEKLERINDELWLTGQGG